MNGKFSRDKGKRGEREIANIIKELTGWDVKRKVRNLVGESDLEGVPNWSIEVKNCATLSVPAWWMQTTTQAMFTRMYPVLFYKVPRKGWRAVWPVSVILSDSIDLWPAYDMTCESSVEAWAAVAREVLNG